MGDKIQVIEKLHELLSIKAIRNAKIFEIENVEQKNNII